MPVKMCLCYATAVLPAVVHIVRTSAVAWPERPCPKCCVTSVGMLNPVAQSLHWSVCWGSLLLVTWDVVMLGDRFGAPCFISWAPLSVFLQLLYSSVAWWIGGIMVMVALCNRPYHYIFALWFLSIYLPFFPRLISAVGDWMSTIFQHMVWP